MNEESRKVGKKKPDRMHRIYRIWNPGWEKNQILPILLILSKHQALECPFEDWAGWPVGLP